MKPQKRINGETYLRDSMGCYIPKSLIDSRIRARIHSGKDAMPSLTALRFAEQETVAVCDLDGNNQIIQTRTISIGLVNSCQLHPREVYRGAIVANAVSILLAHNHPSGNLEPSESDLISTRRMVEVGKTVGILVLDHLIVSGDGFNSLREKYPVYFN